ncbi:MAG TPA: N-acetylneuraminate synthase [Deltaproteobacteria bacterium]|jgi:N-acetylneuraminate synthase/N,N'-diacetyllegionaminate synthase|nr:N-acetylneuraminate synthase [Deltaproteobacteria bacterium]HRR21306.1 N-acetylneuraminate synthase [Desulfomonilia bacterium]HON62709.1 N-acetylneuraminate synthase [Deltaproteobacteria bacterium]HOS27639.1 N-acetylneuraminate synthase [Deltaproteobacteria bacterium]HPA84702.1 N-acetylneuraminate synthase [Deltaproteobacteria bacterium]
MSAVKKRGVFIIAEAGVNHNGSLETAKALVRQAGMAGADAVKFQTFRADALAAEGLEKAWYQKKTSNAEESQLSMLRRLELGVEEHRELVRFCRSQRIMFLSTPFDEQSADLLESLGVPMLKIGSGELTNLPFLRHVARKRRPMIISTGMANLGEVEDALEVVLSAGNREITLLHCVTEYPAPPMEVNLRAMQTLHRAFGFPVGYSDHTEGIEIAVAAAALGASVIEKHFTLDRSAEGPDHRSSLDPPMFADMVRAIRNVEDAMGDGRKRPAPCEIKNIPMARRSVVALGAISKGRVITRDLLAIKRPGDGIAPRDMDKIVGLKARRSIPAHKAITWDDLI